MSGLIRPKQKLFQENVTHKNNKYNILLKYFVFQSPVGKPEL